MKSKKPINEMTREEVESELAENERQHPYYNGNAKWAMRRFELRKALEDMECDDRMTSDIERDEKLNEPPHENEPPRSQLKYFVQGFV